LLLLSPSSLEEDEQETPVQLVLAQETRHHPERGHFPRRVEEQRTQDGEVGKVPHAGFRGRQEPAPENDVHV
jgi:hypothetical protein